MRLHSIQNMQDAITYLYQPQCFPKPEPNASGDVEDVTVIGSSDAPSPSVLVTPSEFLDI